MKNLILVVSILVIFYSCKKNDNSDNVKVITSSFLPMSVGNYWVYLQFDIDSNGNAIQSSIIDSTIISKDTLINGKTYYRFDNFESFPMSKGANTNFVSFEYYRDSSKYLINSSGQILFSETNFADTIYRKIATIQDDTVSWTTGKMEKTNINLIVPAGNFTNLLNLKGTVICNSKFTKIENPRYVNKYYAQEIGEILHSYIYVAGGGSVERRLLRYKINK